MPFLLPSPDSLSNLCHPPHPGSCVANESTEHSSALQSADSLAAQHSTSGRVSLTGQWISYTQQKWHPTAASSQYSLGISNK